MAYSLKLLQSTRKNVKICLNEANIECYIKNTLAIIKPKNYQKQIYMSHTERDSTPTIVLPLNDNCVNLDHKYNRKRSCSTNDATLNAV